MPTPTPAPLTAEREAEIREILADARLSQQRWPGFSDARRPNHPSNKLFNQVEDLLDELDRTRAAMAAELRFLRGATANYYDADANTADAEVHLAAARLGIAL